MSLYNLICLFSQGEEDFPQQRPEGAGPRHDWTRGHRQLSQVCGHPWAENHLPSLHEITQKDKESWNN